MAHAETMKGMHLKDLLQDASRSAELTAEHESIYLDYSRENVTSQTMVSPLTYFYCFYAHLLGNAFICAFFHGLSGVTARTGCGGEATREDECYEEWGSYQSN